MAWQKKIALSQDDAAPICRHDEKALPDRWLAESSIQHRKHETKGAIKSQLREGLTKTMVTGSQGDEGAQK